jgi:Wiskott-Aldrich syndrome protein
LYVVSGGDVVSPSPQASRQKSMSPSRPKDDEPTRRASVPPPEGGRSPARTAPASPFIPITEDDEDAPTVARDRLPAPPPPKRPSSTSPYATLAPGGAKRPSIPPPPPAAAIGPSGPPPPPPLFASSSPSFTAPPPPPMPPSRALADAPYDMNSDMATPLPPPTDEFAPPTPLPTYPVPPIAGIPLPSPGNSWPAAPQPLNLQPPEMIDFAAGAQPLVVKRSGPPGLLVLIVMLGAMAGGAKLAHVVTHGDVAALESTAPK